MAEVTEDQLEVIFGARSGAEAGLVVGFLESAEIPALILDENLTSYQIVMAHAVRGYRIAVPASRRDEAREALIEGGFIDPELQKDVPPDATVCPKCSYIILADWDECHECGEPFDWSQIRP